MRDLMYKMVKKWNFLRACQTGHKEDGKYE